MIRTFTILLLLIVTAIKAQYRLCDSVLIIPASAIGGSAPFAWYVSTGQIDSTQDIDIAIRNTGAFYVTLSVGQYGCNDKVLQRFTVDTCNDWTIWIPNAVTISGVNRSWFPKGYNITVDSFLIFNRWGEITLVDNQEWVPANDPIRYPIDIYGFKVYFTIPGGIRMERYGRVTIIE